MGYTEGSPSTAISTFHTGPLSLDELPNRFAFLYEYPTIGGEHLLAIWNEAKESGASVAETELAQGTYKIYVVQVKR
jgi:hypothetical protein